MNHLRYRDDLETIQPNEERIAHEIVEHMGHTQLAAAGRHRHAHRDAHAKSHALLTGTLRVLDNLPDELAQGAFANAGEHEVVARLSSAPGDIRSDEVPAPRGFALKILGVEGERMPDHPDSTNQDLLMVNFPVLAFGTVARYQEMLGLLESQAERPAAVQRGVAATARAVEKGVERLGRTPSATLQGLARDYAHPLGETYHTQGALRYGDAVAKLSLAPVGAVAELTGRPIEPDFDSNADAIARHFRDAGADYELRVQLCTDLERMPIEDAAVLWDPALSPHRTVATLHLPPQDLSSPARRVHGDDHLSFSPFNGLAAHRPLGSIMRVRRLAYAQSSDLRHRLNAVAPAEPMSASDIPA
ncbi:catalase family protein [Propioniciclava soli]|uniref:catalase family protein n=1 Tax=Propioniciclava soli TaxID=2775081 RepID=UPI001E5558C7